MCTEREFWCLQSSAAVSLSPLEHLSLPNSQGARDVVQGFVQVSFRLHNVGPWRSSLCEAR
jgi:hypothetical protein